MKIVQLNSVCGIGSTGGITVQISDMLTENNIENYILYTYGSYDYPLGVKYSDLCYAKFNAFLAKTFGNYGFNSYISTFKLIRLLNKIKPDIVHLHNIHSHDFNLSMFFKYLKKINVRVVWTFHDCWAFTGYCVHFDMLECGKWQSQCKDCPQKKRYSFFTDNSTKLFNTKKELFTAIDDMTIVTPSKWLAELTKHSFLNKFPIEVINNGIDLDVFVPRESDFRKKHSLENKKIVLGIPKGKFEYFLELNKMLSDDYRLVLVGLNDDEITKMPSDIVALPYTRDRKELAEIFTASDVYINTTLEDTFPTVNLESLACGTPVITFNTGGSPEAIDDSTGMVVEKRNIQAMHEAVIEICNGPDRSKACIERANKLYNKNDRFNEYLDLYLKRGRFE